MTQGKERPSHTHPPSESRVRGRYPYTYRCATATTPIFPTGNSPRDTRLPSTHEKLSPGSGWNSSRSPKVYLALHPERNMHLIQLIPRDQLTPPSLPHCNPNSYLKTRKV